MRRLLKFLHTLGAAGLTGAIAALAIMLMLGPSSNGAVGYLPVMAKTAAWIIGPSMVLTVISGLLAMVATPVFYDAGWVWMKAGTGLLVLEGGLHVIGPMQEEVKRSAGALAGSADPASVARLFTDESHTLWVLLALSVANIALGVWRPRLPKIPV